MLGVLIGLTFAALAGAMAAGLAAWLSRNRGAGELDEDERYDRYHAPDAPALPAYPYDPQAEHLAQLDAELDAANAEFHRQEQEREQQRLLRKPDSLPNPYSPLLAPEYFTGRPSEHLYSQLPKTPQRREAERAWAMRLCLEHADLWPMRDAMRRALEGDATMVAEAEHEARLTCWDFLKIEQEVFAAGACCTAIKGSGWGTAYSISRALTLSERQRGPGFGVAWSRNFEALINDLMAELSGAEADTELSAM